MDQGRLFVVPTPIGNLEDMTLRGVRLLREIETVACEDTRVTGQLLKHLNIVGKRLISLHLHNERGKADELLGLMESGDHVVLVSDAGTPGLSDPGSILISSAIERGIQVEVLPGANAAIPALVGSGLQVRPAPAAWVFRSLRPGSTLSDTRRSLPRSPDARCCAGRRWPPESWRPPPRSSPRAGLPSPAPSAPS